MDVSPKHILPPSDGRSALHLPFSGYVSWSNAKA